MKNKLKEIFCFNSVGFYVNLAAMALAVVTAIVYAIGYSSSRYMSWVAFALLLIGVGVSIVLMVFRLNRFIPAINLVTSFTAFLFFVYYIYFFVSSVVVGIQFSTFPVEFILTVVLYVITIIVNIADNFLPQGKKVKKEEQNEG